MESNRKFLYGILYGMLLALTATGVLLVVARRPPGRPVQLAEAPTPVPARVYVLGAVARPGVYPLPRNSIVEQALAAAGGALPLADLSALNLAQVLQDGDRVEVLAIPPTRTPAPPTRTPAPTVTVGPGTPSPTPLPEPTATESAAPSATGAKLNLNTASAAELEQLPRIGPATAQRILEYRATHGPFLQLTDLMNVKGIGPSTFEQIKDLLTLD